MYYFAKRIAKVTIEIDNADKDDYHLAENFPAYEIGIKPIPLDQIGRRPK